MVRSTKVAPLPSSAPPSFVSASGSTSSSSPIGNVSFINAAPSSVSRRGSSTSMLDTGAYLNSNGPRIAFTESHASAPASTMSTSFTRAISTPSFTAIPSGATTASPSSTAVSIPSPSTFSSASSSSAASPTISNSMLPRLLQRSNSKAGTMSTSSLTKETKKTKKKKEKESKKKPAAKSKQKENEKRANTAGPNSAGGAPAFASLPLRALHPSHRLDAILQLMSKSREEADDELTEYEGPLPTLSASNRSAKLDSPTSQASIILSNHQKYSHASKDEFEKENEKENEKEQEIATSNANANAHQTFLPLSSASSSSSSLPASAVSSVSSGLAGTNSDLNSISSAASLSASGMLNTNSAMTMTISSNHHSSIGDHFHTHSLASDSDADQQSTNLNHGNILSTPPGKEKYKSLAVDEQNDHSKLYASPSSPLSANSKTMNVEMKEAVLKGAEDFVR